MAGSATLLELAQLAVGGPARLGAVRLVTIDGPSGSGKSTVAAELVAILQAAGVSTVLVPTDHFATWTDPFGWWDRLEAGVLVPLSGNRQGAYLANDWSLGEPQPVLPVIVEVPGVLVLEGVSAGRRQIADRATLQVWVEHPDRAARLERAVRRDGEPIRRFLSRWQSAEEAWFDTDDTKARTGFQLVCG